MLKEMAPRKVARKVTQQPVGELKRRNAEKKKRKREKTRGKEIAKCPLSANLVPLAGRQNTVSINTDEHTEVEEPAISSSHSPAINVSGFY